MVLREPDLHRPQALTHAVLHLRGTNNDTRYLESLTHTGPKHLHSLYMVSRFNTCNMHSHTLQDQFHNILVRPSTCIIPLPLSLSQISFRSLGHPPSHRQCKPSRKHQTHLYASLRRHEADDLLVLSRFGQPPLCPATKAPPQRWLFRQLLPQLAHLGCPAEAHYKTS